MVLTAQLLTATIVASPVDLVRCHRYICTLTLLQSIAKSDLGVEEGMKSFCMYNVHPGLSSRLGHFDFNPEKGYT